MNEKEAESLKKTALSQEELQEAGCPEETIRKILQEKNDREQEKLTNLDYLLYHMEK